MIRRALLNAHRYFYSLKEEKDYKKTNKVMWGVCEGLRITTQLVFNFCIRIYALMGLYPKPLHGNPNLVVSLTSFPARIGMLWATIDSIFQQRLQPYLICLYLSEDEFPNKEKDLPSRLLNYERKGLKIYFCSDNLMPHKKYFYALQEFKENCVVTIDDDIYYHEDMLERLWSLHTNHPGMVCANSYRHIVTNEKGDFLPYATWNTLDDYNEKESHLNLAIGMGGVLYPPHNYAATGMFDVDNIKKLALRVDDLWLKAHEIMGGIKVISRAYCNMGISLLQSGNISLSTTNVSSGNNEQWEKLCIHFNLKKIIT